MEKTKRILLCFLKVLIPDYEFENVEQLMKDERCMRVVAIFTKTFSSQKNFLSLVFREEFYFITSRILYLNNYI